ncbi:30S ribosomal protein S17 [Candidatus Dojkabacteria bacterium]|nr:30S ribosomal protein S17 [Candidatus Dojkabacteria bacterium]
MAIQKIKGEVVSTGMTDTVVISVKRAISHPIYSKRVFKSKKYMIHAPGAKLSVGDIIEAKLVRPISKNKKWAYIKKTKK